MKYMASVLTALLLGGAGGGLLSSCTSETENIFPASSAVREQYAMETYKQLLTSQEYGWAMDFYPSDMVLGGIAYTAFFQGDEVELRSEMLIDNAKGDKKKYAAGTPVKSDFRIVAGKGVVLTFDTYNALMHYWSQPSGTDADGLATDYEFTFVSACADSVVLRGCKYGNLLKFYPLQEDAATYIDKVIQMRTQLSDIPRKRAEVNGQQIPITAMSSHLLYDEGDSQCDVPYIYTPTGIRFYHAVTLAGVSVSEMFFDQESHDLYSADRSVVFPLPTPLELFCGTTTQWHFIYGKKDTDYDMCDELRELMKTAITRTTRENNENIDDFYIGMNKQGVDEDAQRMVIGWSTSTSMVGVWYELRYGLDMSVVNEADMLVNLRPLDGGRYVVNYPQVRPVIDFIGDNSPFRLEFDDVQNPKYVRLTSQEHPDRWFALKL